MTHCALITALALALLASPSSSQAPAQPDVAQPIPDAKPATAIPAGSLGSAPATPVAIIYHAREIFLPVRIGNPADAADLLFLLDTGASASAIDRATADRLALPIGQPTRVEGTAGIEDVATCQIPSLTAGGVTVENLTATTQDLGGILAPPGKHVDGILGGDFLRGLFVRVDFAASTLVIARGPAATALPELATVDSIPLTLDNGIPHLSGKMDGGVRADFRLDTGASLFETTDVYLNITQDDWERLRAHDPQLVQQGALSATGAGGEIQLPLGRIRTLALGPIEIAAPYVIVQPRVGYFARADAVGFLSNNLLEKCSPVTIDYAAQRLYLSRPTPPP